MRTFILLLLMQLVSLPFSYARQPEHSTYLVAHDLKSLDYVRQIDYAQFDYIYLMAKNLWFILFFKEMSGASRIS